MFNSRHVRHPTLPSTAVMFNSRHVRHPTLPSTAVMFNSRHVQQPSCSTAVMFVTNPIFNSRHVRHPNLTFNSRHVQQPSCSTAVMFNSRHVRHPTLPSTAVMFNSRHVQQPSCSTAVMFVTQPYVFNSRHVQQPSCSTAVMFVIQPYLQQPSIIVIPRPHLRSGGRRSDRGQNSDVHQDGVPLPGQLFKASLGEQQPLVALHQAAGVLGQEVERVVGQLHQVDLCLARRRGQSGLDLVLHGLQGLFGHLQTLAVPLGDVVAGLVGRTVEIMIAVRGGGRQQERQR